MNEHYRDAAYHLRWSARHLRAGLEATTGAVRRRVTNEVEAAPSDRRDALTRRLETTTNRVTRSASEVGRAAIHRLPRRT